MVGTLEVGNAEAEPALGVSPRTAAPCRTGRQGASCSLSRLGSKHLYSRRATSGRHPGNLGTAPFRSSRFRSPWLATALGLARHTSQEAV